MKVLQNIAITKKLILVVVILMAAIIAVLISYPYINTVVDNTTKINKNVNIYSDLLGFKGQRNILILFMNSAETRHGGGFIGSVGVVSTKNGSIEPGPIRSVYYYDHLANDPSYYVESQKNLNGEEVKQSYTLRDSGQNMSWDANARRAKQIFEKESGRQIDYVVGFTPEVLKNLLKTTGAISLEDYNMTVTDTNLLETIQLEVESGRDKIERKDPKTILTSVANKLVERIANKPVVEILKIGLSTATLADLKQIMVFSSNDSIQNALSEAGLTGILRQFEGDYLSFSETNLFGTKTGSFMKRSMIKNTTVDKDGGINVEAIFERRHTATERMYKYYDPIMEGENYLVAHDNVSIKIALPGNTKIMTSSVGLNIVGREKGYDIYSTNSIITDMSLSSQIVVKYKLPYNLYMSDRLSYSDLIQLPAGTHPITITNCLTLPENYSLVASNIKSLYSDNLKNKICYDKKDTLKDEITSFVYAKR